MLMFLFVGEVVAGIYAFARRNYVSIVLATGLKEVD
jgi:hypothetical protein